MLLPACKSSSAVSYLCHFFHGQGFLQGQIQVVPFCVCSLTAAKYLTLCLTWITLFYSVSQSRSCTSFSIACCIHVADCFWKASSIWVEEPPMAQYGRAEMWWYYCTGCQRVLAKRAVCFMREFHGLVCRREKRHNL